jgi:hypothetical protein
MPANYPVERLEEEKAFNQASREKPGGVPTFEMSQLMGQDNLVMFGWQLADGSVRHADFSTNHAPGQRYGDSG